RNEVVALFESSDPLVRENAVGALAYHGLAVDWNDKFGKLLAEGLESMVRYDEDGDCRRQAVAALGTLFRETNNCRVRGLLTRVCVDAHEEDDVRAFAYQALLRTTGWPQNDIPNPIGLLLGERELELARLLGREPEPAD